MGRMAWMGLDAAPSRRRTVHGWTVWPGWVWQRLETRGKAVNGVCPPFPRRLLTLTHDRLHPPTALEFQHLRSGTHAPARSCVVCFLLHIRSSSPSSCKSTPGPQPTPVRTFPASRHQATRPTHPRSISSSWHHTSVPRTSPTLRGLSVPVRIRISLVT